MGLFDGTIKKFGERMVERINHYASVFETASFDESASQEQRQIRANTAFTLRMMSRIITEVAELESA